MCDSKEKKMNPKTKRILLISHMTICSYQDQQYKLQSPVQKENMGCLNKKIIKNFKMAAADY